MSRSVPICRTVTVFAFRGDRSAAFGLKFQRLLEDERKGLAQGPTLQDSFRYAGHAGVSTDDMTTIHAFHPNGSGFAVWQLMDRLKNGDAFPGIVRDDTAYFAAMQRQGLPVLSFNIILPDPAFVHFQQQLDSERAKSQYLYGFPDGDGDCNCVTWLECLGLPLLTGRMAEFLSVSGVTSQYNRRFGRCL